MSENDVVAWLYEQASMLLEKEADMGAMENALKKVGNEACRRALERIVQEKADHQDMICPGCEGKLNIESYQRARNARTSFDVIRFTRDYGFCSNCKEYFYPVDVKLGLHTRAAASPKVQGE